MGSPMSADELRNIISRERERHEYILDLDARARHKSFILGLEAALND